LENRLEASEECAHQWTWLAPGYQVCMLCLKIRATPKSYAPTPREVIAPLIAFARAQRLARKAAR
jgi:hypothetical protein